MASVTEKQLSAMIKSGELSGAFYIYGSDLYSTEQYKRSMVQKLVRKGDEACNLHEFQGKDIDVPALSEICEGYPFFADKLCITVCDLDLDSEKLPDADMKLLLSTVQELPETTVLIFYAADIDVCDGKKYPTPKNKKLIDCIAKCGTVCNIPLKTKGEAVKILVSAFSKAGCTCAANAAELLYERCGGDMMLMMNEKDKLASYAAGGNIDTSAVEMLTPESGDAKAYELADAVAAGNMNRAALLYNELIDARNEPVYLLYVLTGSMNDLYSARLAIDYSKSMSDIMEDFGYKKNLEFRIKKAMSSVRGVSARRLHRCMEILAQADIDMKSGAGIPAVILETAIVKMLSVK